MSATVNSSRNLTPFYLNKEIFIRFNSPPLHVLAQHIIPELAEEMISIDKMEFLSKTSHRSVFKDKGSTVGNYRKKAEESQHLPMSYFE